MRWSFWLGWVWTHVKRFYPALVATLIVAALAVTFYSISQARAHTPQMSADTSATATPIVTSAVTATPSEPPLSGPTPTAPTGGIVPAPSTGKDPFIPLAVTAGNGCAIGTIICNDSEITYCINLNPLPISGYIYMPKNAPDGYLTYRWRLSDGTITAPAVEHYSWNDKYGQNLVQYEYTPNPAVADGRAFWVQLEVMSPIDMISQPSPKYVVQCLPSVSGAAVMPMSSTSRIYDCSAGGTQSFPYTASATFLPSPSFTFSYYWRHDDGTVTPTQTVTTTGGTTSVALRGDSITLSPPPPQPPTAPSPIATYTDTLVIINAPAVNTQTDVHQLQAPGQNVLMPNCSDITPTPTPTTAPAPTPTATPIPSATATP